MADFIRKTIRQIQDSKEIDNNVKRFVTDKMAFVARHLKDIMANENFYVQDITACPELSTSDIFVDGEDENNLAFAPARVVVFIEGIDSEDEELDEFKSIKFCGQTFHYLVLGNM